MNRIRGGIVFGLLAVSLGFAEEKHTLRPFEKQQLTKEFWSEGATFGDFNKDGKMDVVAGPYWYEGPDFKTRHEYYPNVPYEKDGQYFGSCDSKLGAKDNPKGPFPITTYSDNFFAFTGDFNGDGWTDIVILGFPGRQTCWYENPKGKDGHWARHVAFDVTDNESPGMHDLLANGKPVLVCSSRGQYGYAQPDPANPNAMWKWHPITPPGDYQRFTHGMGVGDVNGDGRPDLLEKDGWWEQLPAGTNQVLWKKHSFQFAKAGGSQMCVADINGDGKPDVVTSLAAHQYGIAWYENLGTVDGEIAFKKHLIVGDKPEDNKYGVVFSQPHALALVDMDGDGIPDIVTGKRKWAHGLKGDPKPTDDAVNYWFKTVRNKDGVDFIPFQIDNNSGVGTQVVVGDLNGDGNPDVIVGNKLGAFVLIQKPREVGHDEWQKAQPRPYEKKN